MRNKYVGTLYKGNTWQEIADALEQLKSGNDYLQEQRSQVIKRWFANMDKTSEKIVDAIVKDYQLSCTTNKKMIY